MFSDWLKSLLVSYGNIWIKYVGKIPGNGRFTIPDLLSIKNTVIVNYRENLEKNFYFLNVSQISAMMD